MQESHQAMPQKKSMSRNGVADVSWLKPAEDVFSKKRFLDQFRSSEEKRTGEGLVDVPLAWIGLPEDVLPPKKQLSYNIDYLKKGNGAEKSPTILVQPSEGVQAINNVTAVQSCHQNEGNKCATWMKLPEIVLQPNKKLPSRIACLMSENEDGQSAVDVPLVEPPQEIQARKGTILVHPTEKVQARIDAPIMEPSEDLQVGNNVIAQATLGYLIEPLMSH